MSTYPVDVKAVQKHQLLTTHTAVCTGAPGRACRALHVTKEGGKSCTKYRYFTR